MIRPACSSAHTTHPPPPYSCTRPVRTGKPLPHLILAHTGQLWRDHAPINYRNTILIFKTLICTSSYATSLERSSPLSEIVYLRLARSGSPFASGFTLNFNSRPKRQPTLCTMLFYDQPKCHKCHSVNKLPKLRHFTYSGKGISLIPRLRNSSFRFSQYTRNSFSSILNFAPSRSSLTDL